MIRAFVFILAMLPGLASAASIDEVDSQIGDLQGNAALFHVAFDAVQKAVAADDAEALADWLLYPMQAVGDDGPVSVDDRAEFIAKYPHLFTAAVKAAVTAQSYEDLFVNDQGVMFGDGQLWMGAFCKTVDCSEADWRILTVQQTN
ncbi:MAG: hypothetical protein ABI697_01850 [Devosia sp.]